MSQPVRALAPLPFELVYDDGEPLETNWHAQQIPLTTHLIRRAMLEQGRTDFFTGGNLFVYYSIEQAREVALEEEKGLEKRAFRGPDVFWVGGVDPNPEREIWIAWEEDGRLPDMILELLSPSTAKNDRTVKKDLYARVFGTSEYFLYDPDRHKLEGFRLAGPGVYRPLMPDAQGRLRSEQLGVLLGIWHGLHEGREADWVRLFRPDGSLVPTEAEAEREEKEAERQRADAEHRRAETAEAELARLRALLGERGAG
ncbi:MAG TPA: Uma2 family endonuclease [Thermoanaerobaculia bacterium]|nr:Uma2 family endonuclease [Thermoanaerobaculia bacterium]